jgi:Ca2+-binding RTX toxin-like protein
MTVGTEGNDVLSNDRWMQHETIDALGGDDRINVTTAYGRDSVVAVDGGAGTDTLAISATYISSLSATSAFIHEGRLGPQSNFRFQNDTSITWSGIERLVVSGAIYFEVNPFGNPLPPQTKYWTTGDTHDEIHVISGHGFGQLVLSTEGGDDKVYLESFPGQAIVYAGAGNDLVDLSGSPYSTFQAFGGSGDDILIGGPGNDQLDGGPGADSMTGGGGADFYVVDDPGDTVVETDAGTFDRVDTALAAYTLPANVEQLYATNGGAHDFTLNSAANYVQGNSGNDLFRLQSGGDDQAVGQGGDDVFYFGNAFTGADRADGGSGVDTVVLQGSYAMTLDPASLTGVETLSLQGGGNPQWGDTANNLYSYAITTVDANVPSGQQLVVDAQSLRNGETLTFNGSAETDGSFAVYGGAGIDGITGGSGNDVISGGGGADTLTGGAGNDSFVYDAAADAPVGGGDSIMDFSRGDRIDLSSMDADPSTAEIEDAFTFIGRAPFHGHAGELRVEGRGGNWIVSGDLDGDRVADFEILVYADSPRPLLASDFLL